MGAVFLVLVTGLGHATAGMGVGASDTIFVRLDISPGAAEVEVRYPPTGVALPLLALPPWAGRQLGRSITDFRAATSDGEPLWVRQADAGAWEVAAGGAAFTITYRLRADKESLIEEGWPDVYRPTLTDRLALLWGVSWFVRPLDAALALHPVRLTAGSEYGSVTLLGGDRSTFRDTEDLAGSVLVAGALRSIRAEVQGQPLRLLIQGDDWRFSDQDLLEAIGRIVKVQHDAMGFLPPSTLDVALLEGARGQTGGAAEGGAIVLFPDPRWRLTERDPETLRLLAHEHFHRWIGEYAYGSPARGEGRYKWFHEGVTEYLAYCTLVRAGFLDPGDLVFKINQFLELYEANPAATVATADDMEREYWLRPEYQALAYQKGFLLALGVDARIQATGDDASIWDFVRRVAEPTGPREYDDEVLLEALERLTGQDWSGYFTSYMLGSDPLDIAATCRDAGLDCRSRGGALRLEATARSRAALGRLTRR